MFGKLNQRDGFRRYLEGLLLPTERNKTVTGLAKTEPYVGAQHPRAQGMQWFLSESTWQERYVQEYRLRLLLEEPGTAPHGGGALMIDEHGDRKRGHKTAHVGEQYLANLGKLDTGVVSVTSLRADGRVYYPVDFEPYTPADYFPKGKQDPQFRTKLKIGLELVRRAVQVPMPFRAVVADTFYGEDRSFRQGLRELKVGYVLALKPSHAWWHPVAEIGSFQEAAQEAGWERAKGYHRSGYLLDLTTFYLNTNLPALGAHRAQDNQLAAGSREEVVRLYGLCRWVEQSRHSGEARPGPARVSSQK